MPMCMASIVESPDGGSLNLNIYRHAKNLQSLSEDDRARRVQNGAVAIETFDKAFGLARGAETLATFKAVQGAIEAADLLQNLIREKVPAHPYLLSFVTKVLTEVRHAMRQHAPESVLNPLPPTALPAPPEPSEAHAIAGDGPAPSAEDHGVPDDVSLPQSTPAMSGPGPMSGQSSGVARITVGRPGFDSDPIARRSIGSCSQGGRFFRK